MVGLDATDGTEWWRREATGGFPGFKIGDDVLVTVEDDGLTGIDLATGEDLWHSEAAQDV